MSNETSKAIIRRSFDQRFTTRYFVGNGIDIGAGNDGLGSYTYLFPLMRSCRSWDMGDGDAQKMSSVPADAFDFVHSSHCLEHLRDPSDALFNWIRICKPGGYIVVIVPDEDLYEQGVFPSTFNGTHIHTFTIQKHRSWSKQSINLFDLMLNHTRDVQPIKIELLDNTFKYNTPRHDQTWGALGECAIEFVLRKKTAEEIQRNGRLPQL